MPGDMVEQDALTRGADPAFAHQRLHVPADAERAQREILHVHAREREIALVEREQRPEIAVEQPQARRVVREAALQRTLHAGEQRLERRAVHADGPQFGVVQGMNRAFATAFENRGAVRGVAVEPADAFHLEASAAADDDRDDVAAVAEMLPAADRARMRTEHAGNSDRTEAAAQNRAAPVGRSPDEIGLHVEHQEAFASAHHAARSERGAGDADRRGSGLNLGHGAPLIDGRRRPRRSVLAAEVGTLVSRRRDGVRSAPRH